MCIDWLKVYDPTVPIIVLDSALKHEIAEKTILYCFKNRMDYYTRYKKFIDKKKGDERLRCACIAFNEATLKFEMLAELRKTRQGYCWLIYHALKPPTPNFLRKFNEEEK